MSAVPKVSKVAMKNIIGSVNIHNRIVEETECWRQRRIELSDEQECRQYSHHKHIRNREKRKINDERAFLRNYHAHMDSDEDPKLNHLIKLYDQIESTCPDRWGHSGYKELYPEQFTSMDEKAENEIDDADVLESKKKKKHKSRKRKLSSEDHSEDDEQNIKKKKRKRHSSTSDDEDSPRRHKKNKTKKRKHSTPESSSASPVTRKHKSKKRKNKKKSKRL